MLSVNCEKILFVMLGGIGNFVLCLPALNALRKTFPRSYIALLVGEPAVEGLARRENIFDDVVLYDRRKGFGIYRGLQVIRSLKRKGFTVAFAGSHMNPLKTGILMAMARIPRRIGQNISGRGCFYTDKIVFDGHVHELDGNAIVVAAAGVKMQEKSPRLTVSREDEGYVDRLLCEYNYEKDDMIIGLHAGSGFKQTFKRWPPEKFAELADTLIQSYGVKILWTGGAQEKKLAEYIINLMKEPSIHMAGRLSIYQTMALIKRCNLFVSNDSGLAHIAAAVQTPLVVLFGPTDERRIAPIGPGVVVCRGRQENNKDMESIEVKDVLERVAHVFRSRNHDGS